MHFYRPSSTIGAITRRDFLKGALLAPALPWFGRALAAPAAGPNGLQLVVPTPPGSQPDLIARWWVEPLSAASKLPVLVLNVPGAAGALAADAVLQAPPERGSMLLGGLDHVA